MRLLSTMRAVLKSKEVIRLETKMANAFVEPFDVGAGLHALRYRNGSRRRSFGRIRTAAAWYIHQLSALGRMEDQECAERWSSLDYGQGGRRRDEHGGERWQPQGDRANHSTRDERMDVRAR